MLLNQLLGNFSALDRGACTAAKTPMGTELGPITLQQAVAVAAMMMIMGMQRDHVMFAIEQPAQNLGIPPIDVINKARRMIENDDVSREVNKIVGAGDAQAIIDYADNYVSRNSSGYEDWMAFRDMRFIREEVVTIHVHAHQYSDYHGTLLEQQISSEHQTPEQFTPITAGLFSGARSTRVVHVTPLPAAQYGAMVTHLNGVDRSISTVAGVLTTGFEHDLLCCIARFLGHEDIARLRKLQGILAIARGILSNGINFWIATPGEVLDWAVYGIQQEILNWVNKYFDEFAEDILDFVNEHEDVTWDSLFACPLIEDLLVFSLDVVAQMRGKVMEYVEAFLSSTWTFHNAMYKRWGGVYDMRRLDTILAIISSLIDAIEACAEDDEGSPEPPIIPNPGEDPTIFEAVPRPLKLPDAVIEKFFRSREPVKREEGQRPIPAVGTMQSSTDALDTRNFRDVCRGILPNDLLQSLTRSR
jgi:hypothetical protein